MISKTFKVPTQVINRMVGKQIGYDFNQESSNEDKQNTYMEKV